MESRQWNAPSTRWRLFENPKMLPSADRQKRHTLTTVDWSLSSSKVTQAKVGHMKAMDCAAALRKDNRA